jgi:hypothetical protein
LFLLHHSQLQARFRLIHGPMAQQLVWSLLPAQDTNR